MINEALKPKIIEQFHLMFLSALVYRYKPQYYVLKGGTNMRYFFNSPRYSNDIDLDLIRKNDQRLESVVDLVLASNVIMVSLRSAGISIVNISKPKQTYTTHRWKLGLLLDGTDVEIRTKIEFSCRNGDYRFDKIDLPGSIAIQYGITPYILQKYNLDAMVDQKIMALAKRSATKARDLFDLEILFRKHESKDYISILSHEDIYEALLKASELTYIDFKEQVIPFISEDFRPIYSSIESWNQMHAFVIKCITKTYKSALMEKHTKYSGNRLEKGIEQ